MDQQIRIQSVNDLMNVVTSEPEIRYYYRGVPSRDYSLTPKLLRKATYKSLLLRYDRTNAVQLQEALLQRFKRYAAPYYRGVEYGPLNRDFGEWLCVAQHHGLPTLLLDWTLNPFTALFFAVTGTEDEESSDAAVWCMNLLPKNKRRRVTIHLEDNETLPKNPGSPLLVVPQSFTRRIEAQAGRFTYSKIIKPLDKLGNSLPLPWEQIWAWVVDAKSKEKIRKELRTFQIHEGTMFPDLDGYARYLSNGGL